MLLVLYHKKDKLDEIGTGIAPNEITPLIDFLMIALAPVLGTVILWNWDKIKNVTVNLYRKLGKKDTADKLESADDAIVQQAVNQVKQKYNKK